MDTPSYDDRNGKRKEYPSGAPSLPTITVHWDAAKQQAVAGFDPADFKTWDFVIAVLKMATENAEFNRNQTRIEAMRQHAMAAQQQQIQAAQTAQQISKLALR